jgi:pimeloyl-ACP methyl ester carboxylesterase
VLIIRGEHDGIATEADLLNYFRALPNKDKQFVIIPGQAHVSYLGVNRGRFNHVMREFLTLPGRLDSLKD